MNRRKLFQLALAGLLAANTTPIGAWDWLWAHQFDSSGFLSAYGGATDGSGVYVTGSVFGDLPGATSLGGVDAYVRKLDHAGNVMWTERLGTSSYDASQGVAVDADGVYITGTTCGAFAGHAPLGGCDAFVLKLRSDGGVVWVTQFGTPGFDTPYQYGAIAVHTSGIYVAGKTTGTFPGGTQAGGPNTFLARV